MISLGGSVSNVKVGVRKFVNLVKQIQNSGMSEVEVAELLKIVNGYPTSIRIEYDRASVRRIYSNFDIHLMEILYLAFIQSKTASSN
jgi:hypothetical protein